MTFLIILLFPFNGFALKLYLRDSELDSASQLKRSKEV